MQRIVNQMFNFTPPHTNGWNIKNISKFAVLWAAHDGMSCAAFFGSVIY